LTALPAGGPALTSSYDDYNGKVASCRYILEAHPATLADAGNIKDNVVFRQRRKMK